MSLRSNILNYSHNNICMLKNKPIFYLFKGTLGNKALRFLNGKIPSFKIKYILISLDNHKKKKRIYHVIPSNFESNMYLIQS